MVKIRLKYPRLDPENPCTAAFIETNIISRDSIIYKQLTDNLERWEFGNTESARKESEKEKKPSKFFFWRRSFRKSKSLSKSPLK